MRIKAAFLSVFICITVVLFSQAPQSPGSILPARSKNQPVRVLDGDQAIVTSYTRTACGLNYVYASNPLYARTGNNYSVGVAQPATFSISGIPACATIEKAFLYVGTSGASVSINVSITNPGFGNSSFPMTLIGSGPDKNWGFAGSYTYRADVTAIIAGNGGYFVSGIPTSTVNTGDDANGATLLIIYSDRSQSYTGSIVIADGCFVNANAAGSAYTTITGFDVCGTPTLSTNFMLLDDMQGYDSTFIALNSAVTNYTQLPTADKPWQLLTDPGTTVNIGQTSADFGLINTADTVGWMMAGLYFQSDCLVCPLTLSLSASSTPSCLGTASVVVSGGQAPYTYVWSGTPQTTSDVTGLSAGVYTVTANDDLGCISGSTTVNVLTPAPPIGATNATVCVGFSTNLSAGAASAYTWNPGGSLNVANQQNVVATPLSTTIYSIDFVDALGCTGTATAEVLVTFTQAITVSNATLCQAQTINLATNGFTGDFYLWTGPLGYTASVPNPAIPNATTLMSGAYNLSVTSIPGCTSTAVSIVNVFPVPNPTVSSNAPICTNFNLNLSSGGGVNYSWAGPNGFVSAVQNPSIPGATPVNSGIYTVTASFLNGCANTNTTAVVIYTLPAPSIITNSNVCIGRPLNLSGNGGVTYQWVGPNGFSSNQQNTGIPAVSLASNGVYTLTVTSGNNCQAQATFTLAALLNPTVSATGTTVCYGAPATLTANGLGFYTWLGPNNYSVSPLVPTTSISVVDNLSAGVYTVILISALNSCSANATTTLGVLPLPVPVASGTNVCLNSPATLTVTGGVNYDWAGPAGYIANGTNAFIPAANPLTTGVYTAIVTAANTCTSVTTTTLGTIPLPTVSATGTVICLNEPFTLMSSGAQTYTWTGPSSYSAVGANAFIPIVSNLSAGNYTVFAIAANSCTGTATAAVTTMSLPVITTTGSTVCYKEPAVLKAAGGLTNTTGYTWTGPGGYISYAQNAIIPSAVSVAPQVYTVVGTAPNSCTNVTTANLATLPLPTVSATGTTICFGEPFLLQASGANSYTWSGPNSVNTSGSATHLIPTVNALSSGVYQITGMDIYGCKSTGTTMVNTMPLPVITATGCSVCIFQSATLCANGGIPGGYSWTGPGNYTSTAQNAFIPIANSVAPLTFTVVGTGPNTCTNYAVTSLKTYPLPLPSYNATATVCLGKYVTLQGLGAQTYTWTGPRHFISRNQEVSFPTYSISQSGQYILSVTDSLGCKNFTTATVKVNPLPEGYLVSDNTTNYCVPFCSVFGFKRTTPSPIVTTNWSFYNDTTAGETFTFCASQAAVNKVTGIVTDAQGCSDAITFTFVSNPKPSAEFVYSPSKPVENVDEVILTNLSQGENITNYSWFFADSNKEFSTETNTSYVFDDKGEYYLGMIVTNKWGCQDSAYRTILVESDVKLYVPSAFTPNNDGLNETFQPKGRGIVKYQFEIYTRWGQKIFSTTNFDEGWDGKIAGEKCANDIYVWKIFATDVRKQNHDLTGHVTLIR